MPTLDWPTPTTDAVDVVVGDELVDDVELVSVDESTVDVPFAVVVVEHSNLSMYHKH